MYWRAARVAVLSAKEHSPNLLPVLLLSSSGSSSSPALEAHLQWLQDNGVIVYRHNLTFMHDLQVSMDMCLRLDVLGVSASLQFATLEKP